MQGAVSRLTEAKAAGERERMQAHMHYEEKEEQLRVCLSRIARLECFKR